MQVFKGSEWFKYRHKLRHWPYRLQISPPLWKQVNQHWYTAFEQFKQSFQCCHLSLARNLHTLSHKSEEWRIRENDIVDQLTRNFQVYLKVWHLGGKHYATLVSTVLLKHSEPGFNPQQGLFFHFKPSKMWGRPSVREWKWCCRKANSGDRKHSLWFMVHSSLVETASITARYRSI